MTYSLFFPTTHMYYDQRMLEGFSVKSGVLPLRRHAPKRNVKQRVFSWSLRHLANRNATATLQV